MPGQASDAGTFAAGKIKRALDTGLIRIAENLSAGDFRIGSNQIFDGSGQSSIVPPSFSFRRTQTPENLAFKI